MSKRKPQHHRIKLRKEFVKPVLEGKKTFEIRFNDRNYKVGDTIEFIPFDYESGEVSIPEIEGKVFEITYILGGWGLQDNYVVFAFQQKEDI